MWLLLLCLVLIVGFAGSAGCFGLGVFALDVCCGGLFSCLLHYCVDCWLAVCFGLVVCFVVNSGGCVSSCYVAF